ncbi:alpha/beta hydrolase [Maricaulis sp.]|uniref:alpha/beta fold hydrolase n=1 Tax=Maricaulis sp. TaxID=1486257 RepID=UPI00261D9DDD|nr:alpha/beta hydrolase [Maricaulis sp.]
MFTFSIPALALALTAMAQEIHPAPGAQVELGGYRLHVIERGQGPATVVYFHGAGNAAAIWLPVMNALAGEGRHLAFDDPGAGWSDLAPLNATLRQQAFDAERALAQLDAEGPLILVGHSRGGLVALEFARQFRDRVSGVVLVDSSHPNMMLRYRNPADGSFAWQAVRTRQSGRRVPAVSREPIPAGIETRCFTPQRDVSELTRDWPEADAEILRLAYNQPICQPQGLRTFFSDELEYIGQHWSDYHLGDIPLTIIFANARSYNGDEIWTSERLAERSRRLSRDLTSLSTHARLVALDGVSHAIHVDAPDAVAGHIRALIGAP